MDYIPENTRPVVFHGPFEHHTNELWWRESVATVVAIGENEYGRADLKQLAKELKKYKNRPLKIGSFSAGSNVTGIREDTRAVAELLHEYGAFACFDFAGVGACEHRICDALDAPHVHS
jgi:selenocysteine lyase/cysteine desulfurase